MSRIGKMPINMPTGVSCKIEKGKATISGPKGTLYLALPDSINLKTDSGTIVVENKDKRKSAKAIFGFIRASLSNMVKGVTEGWNKTLEIKGVGYRAALDGSDLVLTVGYSHPVRVNPPEGVTFAINESKIVVSGIDKQLVGQTAAKIRNMRIPEPYKGKGIRYLGENVRRKAGKTAKAVGSGTGK